MTSLKPKPQNTISRLLSIESVSDKEPAQEGVPTLEQIEKAKKKSGYKY